MAFVLIPVYGIFGLIFVSIFSVIPALIIAVYWTWKHYEAKPDFHSSAGILFSGLVAAGVAFLLLSVLASADWLRFVLGLLVFVTVYLFLTPLIGAINVADVNNLRGMFSSLGVLSKVLDIPLVLVDQVLKFRNGWLGLGKKKVESKEGVEEKAL